MLVNLLLLNDWYSEWKDTVRLCHYGESRSLACLEHVKLAQVHRVGRTKTEAKIANHIAKKNAYLNGVCNLVAMDYCAAKSLYEAIEVAEIWGVGRKHSKKLRALTFIPCWILSWLLRS
jgi:nucleotidyltransferase/DNA polymerase involved in DNA repair